MIGGSPLGLTLNKQELGSGTCFFCIIPLEDSTHRLIKCSTTLSIRKFLPEILQVLSRCYLICQLWVFGQYAQNGRSNEIKMLFQFLHYWGWQHIWNMQNSCMFDGRHGVKASIKKLKGILMWNFWMLEHVGIIS